MNATPRPSFTWFVLSGCLLARALAQQPAIPAASPAGSTPPAATATDPGNDPVARIRDEGLNRSQIPATLSRLTDIIGPRLTGSPGLRRANEWTRDRFTSWGLANSRLEPWGPFGRGWTLRRFSAQVIAPQSIPLIAFPKAWSPSLGPKPLEADIVHVDITKPADFEKYRGKLRGKVVLDGGIQEMKMRFEPLSLRRNETNLLALANAGEGASGRTPTPNPLSTPEGRAAAALLPSRYRFFTEQGVAVLLQPSRLGEAGNLFTAAVTVYPPLPAGKSATTKAPKEGSAKKSKSIPSAPVRGASPWKPDSPPIIPQITVATEHFNRLVRLAQAGETLRVAVELQADYHTGDPMVANTLAEIPGTDLAGELVMLGAHLDSWHSGTGATDNAAGSVVVMEAVRILRTLDLKPRRTIRVALWTGEEQGLLGSKAYVADHFGSPKAPPGGAPPLPEAEQPVVPRGMASAVDKKPAYERLSAYFNLDNGSGKIRGIYLQNNEAARPIFREWLKPFRDLGAETVSLASTSATDHVSFDTIGLPGFQFIQDELEYNTRTHHGNMDVYDRAQIDDLKQAAVIMATFVYQAAMRDEKIPRKPLPAPPTPPAGKTAAAGDR